MTLPLPRSFAPMEATLVGDLPDDPGWQFEPKWDGFRCLAFRDGERVDLVSKAGKPLQRYFPELVAAFRALRAKRFVLDGEIVVARGAALDFDRLLQRIHPAASRIAKLSAETPAAYIAFDLLVDSRGRSLVGEPLSRRRRQLERFLDAARPPNETIRLSPASARLATVRTWMRSVGKGLDGIIAKRVDVPYASGKRDAMLKMKLVRSADCVVGGFRYASRGRLVGSLLLGLYDDDGQLHHVGFTSGIKAVDKPALTKRLEELRMAPGFTGQAPGGPSRWGSERSAQWEPVAPKLVAEVQYDHFSGGRFRHGTRFLRWRPDKAPRQCTFEQVEREGRTALALLR